MFVVPPPWSTAFRAKFPDQTFEQLLREESLSLESQIAQTRAIEWTLNQNSKIFTATALERWHSPDSDKESRAGIAGTVEFPGGVCRSRHARLGNWTLVQQLMGRRASHEPSVLPPEPMPKPSKQLQPIRTFDRRQSFLKLASNVCEYNKQLRTLLQKRADEDPRRALLRSFKIR